MNFGPFEANSSTLIENYPQDWHQFGEGTEQNLMPLFSRQEPRNSFDELYPSTSSSELAPVEDILNYFRRSRTKIVMPSKIRDYLLRYPEIAELSRDVSELVHERFDSSAQLSLEIQDDYNPDYEYLALYIRVPDYDDSVMERIRQIREQYAELLAEMTGWFLLTTDFAPTR